MHLNKINQEVILKFLIENRKLKHIVLIYFKTINRNSRKKHHVMRFNSVLNVDFAKWGQVKMERENNQKEFARPEDEMPK